MAKKYEPMKDSRGVVTESPADYVERMQSLLPTWPAEVLTEWFHRTGPDIYSRWRFESFAFS